jgi:cathepsin E
MGPTDLTIGSLHPDVNASIPTVTDNLYKNGTIPYDIFSVSFEPTNKSFAENGEITFGGTDPTKYTEKLTYA